METIKTWIKTLLTKLSQKDKLYHLIINFLVVLFLGVLFSPTIGLAAAIVLSLGKEVYDEYRPNGAGWNWDDLTADLVGILLGLFVIL